MTAASGVITTVAGNGAASNGGDGGLATAASLESPSEVAVDGNGNVYFVGANRMIRRVSAADGMIRGIRQGGAIALDSLDRLYYYTLGGLPGGTIERIDLATGTVVTVAGGGAMDPGDGGKATDARLHPILASALDASGNLYLLERVFISGVGQVRRIDSVTGIITTVAGGGSARGDGGPATAAWFDMPLRIESDWDGNLYVTQNDCAAAFCSGSVRRIDRASGTISTIAGSRKTASDREIGDGGPATAASLDRPTGLAVDAQGDLHVADTRHNRIRTIDASTGTIRTVAGSGTSGFQFIGDQGPATAAELFLSPYIPGPGLPRGLALDAQGNLFISDQRNGLVRRVYARTGLITTLAGTSQCCALGDGGPATAAWLSLTSGIEIAPNGDLYIASGDRVRKVRAADGTISTFAGGGLSSSLGDGGPATGASLLFPADLALDGDGNLYIADSEHHRIRRVDAQSGTITTVAGTGALGFAGDGGPARDATLFSPVGVALDRDGNLFIADGRNNRIRRIDGLTSVISTVAGDGRFASADGDGGPATLATLWVPAGIAIDDAGHLYIADTRNHRVRKVDRATGIITTVAGSGNEGYAGDAGPATRALMSHPAGVAVHGGGDLYLADSDNNRVRAVFACVALSAVELQSPADRSTGLSAFPRLSWRPVAGAFRYDVDLDTVNPPVKLAASEITTNSFAPANLEPLTTYYWRITAKGDPFCSPASTSVSPVRTFTTGVECSEPGEIEFP